MVDQANVVEVEVRLRDLASRELAQLRTRFQGFAQEILPGSRVLDVLAERLGMIDPAAGSAVRSLGRVGDAGDEASVALQAIIRESSGAAAAADDLAASGERTGDSLERSEEALREFGDQADRAESGLRGVDTRLDEIAGATERADQGIDQLRASMSGVGPAAERAETGIEELIRGAQRGASDFDGFQGEVRETRDELRRISGDAREARDELGQVGDGARQAEGDLGRLDAEIRDVRGEFQGLDGDLEGVDAGLADLDSRLNSTGDRIERLGDRLDRTGDRARRAGSELGGFGRIANNQVRNIAGLAAAYFGLSEGIQQAREGLRDFVDVDRSLAEVSTIAPTVDLSALRDDTFDLSRRLGLEEEDNIRAFYQIISAGITEATEAQFLLNEAAELGVAGVASTEQAVDLLATVINGYGLAVEDADRASDVLFKTVELGRTTISDLATNLGGVIPLAAQLNVPLEEVAAGIATITASGRTTGDATSGINFLFTTLLRNAEEVDAVLRQQGSSFDLNSFAARGFQNVLQEITRAYEGNEDGLIQLLERQAAANTLFALTANEGERYAGALEQVGDATGSVSSALGSQIDSTSKQLDILFAGIRQGRLEIGRVIGETLVSFADGFDSTTEASDLLAESIASFAPLIRVSVGLVGGFATVLVGASAAVLELADAAAEFAGFSVISDEESLKLRLLFESLEDLTAAAITGEVEFSDSVDAQARLREFRREEELQKAGEAAEGLITRLGQLQRLLGQDDFIPSGFFGAEGIDIALRELDAIAQESGVQFSEAFRAGVENADLDFDALVEAARGAGSEIDTFLSIRTEGGFAEQLQEITASIESSRELLAIESPETEDFTEGLQGIRREFDSQIRELLRQSEVVGEELPDALLGQLVQSLATEDFPALQVAARLGIDVPQELREQLEAVELGQDLEVTAGLSVTLQRDNIEAAIVEAQAEISALQEEINAGTAEQSDLVAASLDLRRLEAELLGIQNSALADQAERIIAAVDAQRAGVGVAQDTTNQLEGQIEAARSLRDLQIETLSGLDQELARIESRGEERKRQLAEEAQGNDALLTTLGARLSLLDQITQREREAALEAARAREAAEAQRQAEAQGSALERSIQNRLRLESELAIGIEGRLSLLERETQRQLAQVDATQARLEREGLLTAELERSFNLERAALRDVGELRERNLQQEEELNRIRAGSGGFLESFRFGLDQATQDLDTFGELAIAQGELLGSLPRGLAQEFVRTGEIGSEFFDRLKDQAAALAIEFLLLNSIRAVFGEGFGDDGISSDLVEGSAAVTAASVLLGNSADRLQAAANTLLIANTIGAGASASGGSSASFFATGGIQQGQLLGFGDLPVRQYAIGGIARTPQIAVFGEVPGQAEAFVPLPDGENIPAVVDFRNVPISTDPEAVQAMVEVAEAVRTLAQPLRDLGGALQASENQTFEVVAGGPPRTFGAREEDLSAELRSFIESVPGRIQIDVPSDAITIEPISRRLINGESRRGSDLTSFGQASDRSTLPIGAGGGLRAFQGQSQGPSDTDARLDRLAAMVEDMARSQPRSQESGGRMVLELNQTVSPVFNISAVDAPSFQRLLSTPEGREGIVGAVADAAYRGTHGALNRGLKSQAARARS